MNKKLFPDGRTGQIYRVARRNIGAILPTRWKGDLRTLCLWNARNKRICVSFLAEIVYQMRLRYKCRLQVSPIDTFSVVDASSALYTLLTLLILFVMLFQDNSLMFKVDSVLAWNTSLGALKEMVAVEWKLFLFSETYKKVLTSYV